MKVDPSSLTLYVRDYCMFCHRVLRTVEDLGVEIEVKNIWQDRGHEQELLQATGRGTVPVLKIKQPEDDDKWLPESTDIIQYLQTEFGNS